MMLQSAGGGASGNRGGKRDQWRQIDAKEMRHRKGKDRENRTGQPHSPVTLLKFFTVVEMLTFT